MSIELNDFKHIPGENDAEYIKLLETTLEKKQQFIRRNIALIKKLYYSDISNNWVPCTPVTMPEVDDEVLITYIVNGNRKKRFVETARWYPDDVDGYWSSPWDEYRVIGTKVEVIAWMPLPSPYNPENEEQQDG